MAQKKDSYDTAWKKVAAFQLKGLPKSALEVVDRIYTRARTNRDEAQQVKALVYRSRLVQQTDEDEWPASIARFEQEAATAAEPMKQILESITADLYYSYFQQQRYRIYNRTRITGFRKEDPATWTIGDFHRKITEKYEASLQHPQLLQQTALNRYDPVIIRGNAGQVRPTLYDLLAWKALDYFRSDESDISKPAYAFELRDAAGLAPAPVFIRYAYESPDSNSHSLKALRLFQQLLSFHRNDRDKAAFVDADIQRATWVYGKTVVPGKEQLYKELLEQIYTTYNPVPEAAQAGYLLAQWYQQKGNRYTAGTGNPQDRDAFVLAMQYAKEVAAKFPEREGGINAASLIKEIAQPLLRMQVEKVNTPGEPFRALVEFRNVTGLYLRLVPYTDAVEKALTAENTFQGSDPYWAKLVALAAVKSWKQDLPATTDYRQHRAEIKIEALPAGRYLLLSSANPAFSLSKNPLTAVDCYVSQISYVIQNKDCFVLNRTTGQPLAGAKVLAAYTYYDYDSRKTKNAVPTELTTDRNGFVRIPERVAGKDPYGNDQLQLDIRYAGERLKVEEYQYRTYYQEEKDLSGTRAATYEQQAARWFLFTDRSIYRPGQTIYFKAIGTTRDFGTRRNKLYLPEAPVPVVLQDANEQPVDSLQLKVNEWGSISGQFKVPATGLTGRFTILVADQSEHQVAVEEYKRPTFFIEYDQLKEDYRLEDTIRITGFAKAYAGNQVDGATVRYRVYRHTRWLYPWLFYERGIWPPAAGGRTEITHGEARTGANGQFSIRFAAQPDLDLDQSLDPTFDYTIEADITDANGETRSGSTRVAVGYKSIRLSTGLADGIALATDSLKKIPVSATNLSGEPLTTRTRIRIYRLLSPDRLLRNRYWQAPDTTVMTEAAFRQAFPHDPYRNENDYHTWEKGSLVQEDTFTTLAGKSYMPGKILSAGWYLVEVTATDKDGKEVTSVSYVPVYDLKNGKLPAPAYAITITGKTEAAPGENVLLYTGSSAEDLFIVQQTQRANDTASSQPVYTYRYLKPGSGIIREELPVTENDRGGYTVNRFYIQQNRLYTQSWNIQVPWRNKELDITYETFRDKLLPGATETWKVKVKGWKGEKAAAEMLVSLYDASLDQFLPHQWEKPAIWPIHSFGDRWSGVQNFGNVQSQEKWWNEATTYFNKQYDQLLSVDDHYDQLLAGHLPGVRIRGVNTMNSFNALNEEVVVGAGKRKSEYRAMAAAAPQAEQGLATSDSTIPAEQPADADAPVTAIRTNLQETAFFFPDLQTDSEGNITFSFTMPEALTQWKLQTLAHTKDLSFGLDRRTTVTQKDLMVQPNAPRFFREGDRMELSAKVSNLTGEELSGQVQLLLFNTATGQPVDGWFKNVFPNQYFTVPAAGSVAVKFPLEVPYHYAGALTYRLVARAGNRSDGEENAAPVLTNRMLVTESFPIQLRNTTEKHFTWEKLLNSQAASSSTLTNQSLTVEFTTNPAWYAVQALPYLMEYPYECAEQTWNRLYATALASRIANSTPKIKAVFDRWKTLDTAALQSNLEKNPELKQALLEETPWVLEAQQESRQKQHIALLFDMVRLSNEATRCVGLLQSLQSPNGGFVWFKGGPDDRQTTQYIVAAIGHLRKLGILPQADGRSVSGSIPSAQQADILQIAVQAMPYLDARLKEEYDNLVRVKADRSKDQLSAAAIQYLYARSFFPEWKTTAALQKLLDYYTTQARQYWQHRSKYEQGMMALVFNRNGEVATAKAIIRSLEENSIRSESLGRYWKAFNTAGYYWWQSPIESHALLVEAFAEIDRDEAKVNDLKTWLLQQKQTRNWATTKATAEACYALLMQGSNWLNTTPAVSVRLGNTTISSTDTDVKVEAGTGYFKKTIPGDRVSPDMGHITVSLAPGSGSKPPTDMVPASWGAVYWQYFEDLDKIRFAETPLQIRKNLFVQRNTDRGPVLTPVTTGAALKIGDRVVVRIVLQVDRNMEYVHMKDMRAACLEPVNVLSGYKYQDGLGYYESTRDAGTHFFFQQLNRGTYVFEYPLTVTHSGNFSNGITSVQCMYAPAFSAHSEGIRVSVAEKE